MTGVLRGSPAGAMRDLAVAANGRIEAVGRSFRLEGQPTGVLLARAARDARSTAGRNSVEILEVGAGGRLTSLGRF